MPVENVVETDVLVIGGGMAGCFAAIKAKEQGLNVTQNSLGRKMTVSCPRALLIPSTQVIGMKIKKARLTVSFRHLPCCCDEWLCHPDGTQSSSTNWQPS